MRILQSTITALLLLFIISSILPSCKSLKSITKNVESITANVDTLTGSFGTIDTLVSKAVSGALAGITTEESKTRLDTLGAVLSRNVTKYVNQVLDSLDTSGPAEKLITGLKDSLFAQSTTDGMTRLLDSLFAQAGTDFNKIIVEIIDTVSSERTKKKLNSLSKSLVAGITDSLGFKLNQVVQDIDFTTVGDSISSLLTDKVQEKLKNTLVEAVKELTKEEELNPLLDLITSNIKKVIAAVGLTLAGLIWLIYHFRKKGKTRDGLSTLIMTEIYAAGDDTEIKKLKGKIKEKAKTHKLQDQLDKILKEKKLK